MTEGQLLTYTLGIAGALLGVIWLMLRQENKRTEDALDKKASTAALDEAKSNHRSELREMREQFSEQLRELNRRQDREIDWLKEEMGRIGTSLSEMRAEQTAANAMISQNIQQLAIAIQRGRRSETN